MYMCAVVLHVVPSQDSVSRAVQLIRGQLPIDVHGDQSAAAAAELDEDEEKEQMAAVYGVINHDLCDKCHKAGTLVLCEECPAAFHIGCAPQDVPAARTDCDDPWLCAACYRRHQRRDEANGGLVLTSATNPENSAALLARLTKASSTTKAAYRPRLLVHGPSRNGQAAVVAAVLHELEQLPVVAIDMPSLLADTSSRCLDEALVTRVASARRMAPCTLICPGIDVWWDHAPPSCQACLAMLLNGIPSDVPVLFLASSDRRLEDLPEDVQELFDSHLGGLALGGSGSDLLGDDSDHQRHMRLPAPTREMRARFFASLPADICPRPRVEEDDEGRRRMKQKRKRKRCVAWRGDAWCCVAPR